MYPSLDTKRTPRTLNEAFPQTMEAGACIEIQVPRLTPADRVIRVVALVGLIVLVLDLFFWRA
jgi:hypothetical protein